jgi:hypothetical protein
MTNDPVAPAPVRHTASDDAALAARYAFVRARSRALAAPLSPEDATVQSMADASPSKWHLAHTTWFFEQFVLGMRDDYRPVHADWAYLFNSYYNSVGPMHARPQRGLVTRPSLAQVLDYREQVDARMAQAFADGAFDREALQRIMLGTHHEQQHQELLLTDIKHAFARNPLRPAYRDDLRTPGALASTPLRWIAGVEGIVEIGAPAWPGNERFAFDNESPRHRALLHPHALASRPVSNSEFRAFIDVARFDPPAHVVFDDHFRHVQADAGALLAGGEIRVENLFQRFVGNATAIVAYRHGRLFAVLMEAYRHLPLRHLATQNSVPCVAKDIQQCLGIFVGKAPYRHVLAFLPIDGNVVVAETRFNHH